MLNLVPVRNGNAVRQMIATRRLLDTFDRVVNQSSIQLTRLLRIAKGAFTFNVSRLSWTRRIATARRTHLATRTVNVTQPPPLHAPRRYPPKPAFSDTFYRPAVSVPVQIPLPILSSIASLLFKPPTMPSSYIPTRSRQISRRGGRRAGAATVSYFQPNQTRGARSISLTAHTQHLASWVADFSPTYGRLPPPHEKRRAPKPEHGPRVTASSYYSAGHQTSDAMIKLAKTPAGAVSIAPPSRTTAASWASTAPDEAHPSPSSTGTGTKSGQGELVLEGSTLGRWLTQHLSQAIIRPLTGMIGVDPRITPAWAGPSFGT